MTGRPERHRLVRGDERNGGAHALGAVGPAKDPVQFADGLDQRGQVGNPLPDPICEFGEDPLDLLLLRARHLHQLVVGLDHRLRLDEDRLTALGAVVHDAPQARARIGAHGDDVAAMPHGDEPVGDGVGGLEQSLQLADDPAPAVADRAAQLAQPGAGPIGDGALVVEGVAQRLRQPGNAGKRAGHAIDGRRDVGDAPPVGSQPRTGLQDGRDLDQLAPIEHGTGGASAIENRTNVRDDVEGRCAGRPQGPSGFPGRVDG